MTTEPLFTEPAWPSGPIRAALDSRLAELPDATLAHPDLVILTRSLAGRLDRMDACGERRGYVMLAAEYRAARRDLLPDTIAGPDPLQAALDDWRAAQASDAEGPVPAE